MKVVILMENSTCRDTVACAHGLSMYIETDKHKILFDMGPTRSSSTMPRRSASI